MKAPATCARDLETTTPRCRTCRPGSGRRPNTRGTRRVGVEAPLARWSSGPTGRSIRLAGSSAAARVSAKRLRGARKRGQVRPVDGVRARAGDVEDESVVALRGGG